MGIYSANSDVAKGERFYCNWNASARSTIRQFPIMILLYALQRNNLDTQEPRRLPWRGEINSNQVRITNAGVLHPGFASSMPCKRMARTSCLILLQK